MFLNLAIVTSLVTLSLSATYNTVDNLPTVQWDFIIVGGTFPVSVVKMLQHTDTFQLHRGHSRISPCQQIDREPSIQCPCSWSRSYVSFLLWSQVVCHHPCRQQRECDWFYSSWAWIRTCEYTLRLELHFHSSTGSRQSLPLYTTRSYSWGNKFCQWVSVLCSVEPGPTYPKTDGMMYTRGSSSDYDRFAEYSGDPGWSWDNIQQYLRKVSVIYPNGRTYSECF